jgi:hypothetical protein
MMMRFAVFVPSKDFKDESLNIVKLILSKSGIQYSIASYSRACVGSHGAFCRSDINPSNVVPSEYDGFVIIDGPGIDESAAYDYRPLLDTVTAMNSARKYIVIIGNAIKIPARANIIKGKKVTVPDIDSKRFVVLFYGIPSASGIEISGNLITAKDSKSLEAGAEQIMNVLG